MRETYDAMVISSPNGHRAIILSIFCCTEDFDSILSLFFLLGLRYSGVVYGAPAEL